MLELIARVWSGIKLRRGQCEACRGILRDDQTRWCSGECADEYWDKTAI